MTPNPARDAINQKWVAGIPNSGPGYPRMEIDDFCQDYARLNLYLLAMEKLQSNDKWREDMWSWFQIQGIHGAPFITWDGVGGGTLYNWFRTNKKKSRHKGWGNDRLVKSGTADQGYCTHSSVLFPTWHRAYAAMIEQAIQATMVELADLFVDGMMPGEEGPPGPDSLKWQSVQAALMFRQPYWDPFRARAGRTADGNVQMGLSLIFAVKQVKVTRPDLREELINNPLYSYKYPEILANDSTLHPPPARDRFGIMRWAGHRLGQTQTMRHPSGPGLSDHVSVQKTLEGTGGAGIMALMQMAYHVLMLDNLQGGQTAVQGDRIYHRFSTTDWTRAEERAAGRPGPEDELETLSLEAWHNQIHGSVGSADEPIIGGTMASPVTAGHDPIFIFHHSNIDRHFAFWQTLHPEPWLGENSMASTSNTFTAMINTWEGSRTPLLPFRKPTKNAKAAPTTFWSSDDLRDHAVLGYQYEEIPTGPGWDAARRKDAATKAINRRLAWWKTNQPAVDPVRMDSVRAIPQPVLVDGSTELADFWSVRRWTPRVNLRAERETASQRQRLLVADSGSRQDEDAGPVILRAGSGKASDEEDEEGEDDGSDDNKSVKTAKAEQFTTIPGTNTTTIFPPGTMDAKGRVPLWFFNFRVLRHAVGTSFTIYVFLGNFPPNSRDWRRSPGLVLALPQFIAPNPDAFESDDDGADDGGMRETRRPLRLRSQRSLNPRCENCARQEERGAQMAGGAPLTQALIRYLRMGREVPMPDEITDGELPGVRLEGLGQDQVVPFLKRNLHWRVLRSDGQELDRGDIAEFKVFVTHRFMTLPKRDEDTPIYEPCELRWEVTDQRPGGLDHGDVP